MNHISDDMNEEQIIERLYMLMRLEHSKARCDAEGVYGADTDVYEAVRNLQIGDTIDMEGFLYWYEGANPHITSVTVK